jgi:uncharacterized membrane protein
MDTTYAWLKFIHVLAIAVWMGGFASLLILNRIASRHPGPDGVASFMRALEGIGPRLLGPGAGLALLSGVAMMIVGHTGMPLWITWGLVAMALFIAIGVGLLRPILGKLQQSAKSGAAEGDPAPLLGKQRTLMLINLLILVSAVWAMVLKPT